MAWKGGAGTSIASDARLTHFYRALLDVFGPRGTMSLNFVTVAGQRIACLFTMEDGHTLYAAKIGFDPTYAAISPGHLMVAQTAADAERRGLKVFDFLGEAAAWKLKWTDRLREHLWVVVHRPSLRGYARFVWRKARNPVAARPPDHGATGEISLRHQAKLELAHALYSDPAPDTVSDWPLPALQHHWSAFAA